VSGYEIVEDSASVAITFEPVSVDAVATCPSGKKAIGRGGTAHSTVPPPSSSSSAAIVASGPINGGAAWRVTATFGTYQVGFTLTAMATAICAVVG